ncbi:MAG: hypothetical protein ACMUJM_05405 [bacterium]
MGWMSYMFVSDTDQNRDLTQQKADIQRLKSKLASQRSSCSSYETKKRILLLENENDELRLYITALTRLLIAKGMITKEEIEQLAQEIDAEDGNIDGGFKGSIT